MKFQTPKFFTPPYQDGFPRVMKDHMVCHILYLKTTSSGIVLQTNNHCILIDLSHGAGTDIIKNYLIGLGITTIDILVLTHPHPDHIAHNQGGISRFTDNFTIKEVWMNGNPFPYFYDGVTQHPSDTESFEAYALVLNQLFPTGYTIASKGVVPTIQGESAVPYNEPRAGDVETLGDITLRVLNPGETIISPFLNVECMVIQAEYKGKKIMLSADALDATRERLLALYSTEQLKSDLWYVDHHGYDNISEEWVDAIKPDIATVQGDSVTLANRALLATKNIPLYNTFDYLRNIAFDLSDNRVEFLTNNEYNWQ